MFKMILLLETQPNEGKAKGDAMNHKSETLGHAMLVAWRAAACGAASCAAASVGSACEPRAVGTSRAAAGAVTVAADATATAADDAAPAVALAPTAVPSPQSPPPPPPPLSVDTGGEPLAESGISAHVTILLPSLLASGCLCCFCFWLRALLLRRRRRKQRQLQTTPLPLIQTINKRAIAFLYHEPSYRV